MRIAVTGASGLLGLNLSLIAFADHQVYGFMNRHPLSRAPFPVVACDLLDWGKMQDALANVAPDWLIHCAAMADVDQCEQHPQLAYRVNAEVPGKLAAYCVDHRIGFVHLSTDAVFDGKKGDYAEADDPNPLSVYAFTKLVAEKKVLDANDDALVLRVNFYGFSLSGKRSLVEFFLYNLSTGKHVNGFVDVMFCPLYVRDLAEMILNMIQRNLSGLYHVVSAECLSKYAFGLRIAERFGLDKNLIHPISVHESGLAARRSPRLTLCVDKLKKAKIVPPGQREGIEHLYADYLNGLPDQIRSLDGNNLKEEV